MSSAYYAAELARVEGALKAKQEYIRQLVTKLEDQEWAGKKLANGISLFEDEWAHHKSRKNQLDGYVNTSVLALRATTRLQEKVFDSEDTTLQRTERLQDKVRQGISKTINELDIAQGEANSLRNSLDGLYTEYHRALEHEAWEREQAPAAQAAATT